MCLIRIAIIPRNMFWKKYQKQRSRQVHHDQFLRFGTFGFQLNTSLILSPKKIAQFVLFLKWTTPRRAKTFRLFWVNLFPNYPLSKKTQNSRMGKGKGKIKVWATRLRSGTVLFEFNRLRFGKMKFCSKQISARIKNFIIIRKRPFLFCPAPLSRNIFRYVF